MKIFILFIICTCFCGFISNRPLNEENNRENSEAEYEGNDDNKQDEYISEDQESASDEVQRAAASHDDKQESQDDFTQNNNGDTRVDQNGCKEVSDVDLNDDKEAHQNERNVNLKQETDFFPQNEHKNDHSDTNRAVKSTEDLSSLRNHDQKIGNRNLNAGQDPEYSGDLLFKISQENLNKEKNDQMDIEDQRNLVKQHYNKMQQNKDSSVRQSYENTFNIRDRRETQTHQSEATHSDAINESNENSIINNIKKLSDKDLENLLNALPEDKKAILKKIMDKREITKKAGAVDDHGLDSSKLESSFSIDSKTVSDLATDASGANKQSESEESTTKTQENENDSGKTENKSSLNGNGQTLQFNTEAATLSNYNKETFKNDNKREVSLGEHMKQLEQETVDSDVDSTDENSYDSNHEVRCSDNEDGLEPKGDDSNAQKREISKDNMFEYDESVRSLEESFPNADAYDDRNLNMEPLIRVKRTELNHRVKKRDLSSLRNKNIPLNEFVDKGFLKCDRQIKRNRVARTDRDNFQANNSNLNENSELVQSSQYSVDSNSELVKAVDKNIVHNSIIKNKILVGPDKDDSVKLIRSGRTVDPISSDSNFASDNGIDTSNYQGEDSLDSNLEKFENSPSRSKRI